MLSHMKKNAEYFFVGAAVLVVSVGYIWSTVTTRVEPVQWNDGDLVVQRSNDIPVLPVFGTRTDLPEHIGIVHVTTDGPVVIESIGKVVETPLAAFTRRGKDARFVAYRMVSLTKEQASTLIVAARSKLGVPGDFFLDADSDHLYSSELVRVAFHAAGIDVGRTERLGTLAKGNAVAVISMFTGRWTENRPCQRRYLSFDQCWEAVAHSEVIAPAALVRDKRFSKVYDSAPPPTKIAADANASSPAS